MKKIFTQAAGYRLILTSFIFVICFSSQAQTSPILNLKQSHLVSETNVQVGATHKFANESKPYSDKMSVSFESNATGKAEVRLLSATGVVLEELGSKAIIGTNTLELQHFSSQAPGIYIVRICVNGEVITHKKVIKT